LHKPETEIKPVINADFGFTDSTSETAVFTAALEHRCMGVVNELKRRNPSHSSRVYSALFAKTVGMPMDVFEQVWMELGTRMGYVDLHNTEHRQYQMKTLFDDPRFVSFPNCSTLKAKGCCVGEVCPRFIDMGEAPPKRIIKRRWNKK
jgi:DNA primase large subunit